MNRRLITAGMLIIALAILNGCARSPEARRDKYLARGKALLAKHEYSRAILEFRNAAKAMPKDAEPYYEIGVASEDSGDYRTAVAFFRKALEQDSKHAGAQLKLAQLMVATNDQGYLKEAESRLQGLKENASAAPEVLNSLALTELKLGETDQAVENLERSLAKAPSELRSSVLLAQAKLWQHDDKGAEQVLLKASEAAPKSPDPVVILGEYYVTQNNRAEAEAQFRRALSIDGKYGPALMQLGNLERAMGDKQAAERTFKRLSRSGDNAYKAVYAEFLFEEGRRDEAIQELKAQFNRDPSDRLVRTRLIAALQVMNRADDATAVLDNALNQNPKDLDALLQRAEISLGVNKFAAAEADLNEVLRLRPNSGEAHYIRAKLYQARGESYTYRQELSESLRLDPYLLPIRLELVRSFIHDKQTPAALDLLNAAPGAQQEMTAVLIERNWVSWSDGDLAGMRRGIDRGLAKERLPELLLQDGLWKLRTGNVSGARAAFEESLQKDASDVRVLSALSETYVAEKNPTQGLDVVKTYASRQPHSAPVQEFFGNTLLLQGKHDEARSAFDAAKAADPHFLDADFSLVQLDLLDRKPDNARKRLQAILSSDSRNKTAILWLANIEASSGDYDAAIKHYRQVTEGGTANAETLNNLAFLLAEYGHDTDEALKYAQKAVELAPNSPQYRDTLGWVFYKKGLYASALTQLQTAASSSTNGLWKYHLAMAYIKAGDLKHGRENLELALARDPNLAEAKAAEARFGTEK